MNRTDKDIEFTDSNSVGTLDKIKPKHLLTLFGIFILIVCWQQYHIFSGTNHSEFPDVLSINEMWNLSEVLNADTNYTILQNGRHRPTGGFKPTYKVAIIIPYRFRQNHLVDFMNFMHPFLRKKNLEYVIFVVEQFNMKLFNRGSLMNIGFLESSAISRNDTFDCFIFHDVDLKPLNRHIQYKCNSTAPLHMSTKVDTLKLYYSTMFGGVVALTAEQMNKTGGYPNRYNGWGGEDDEFSNRVQFHYGPINHLSETVGTYSMKRHGPDKLNEKNNQRFSQLNLWKKYQSLDTIFTIKYEILHRIIPYGGLFVWLAVNFNETAS